MKSNTKYQKGQTLVILLIYMIIAITITAASVALVLNSSSNTSKVNQGITAFDIAESGAENAMIKLIRDRNYTGETLTIGDGEAEITITGTNPKTMTVNGTLNNFTRTIQVIIDSTGGILTVTSWKEIN